jgi:hypothetical protein
MKRQDPKIFSHSEANEMVGEVAELTSFTVERLQEIRQKYQADFAGDPADVPAWAMDEITKALLDWSAKITELGAFPKGYFTVDFQSDDPELLYCWTYGEDKITHTHTIWENFSSRRPLGDGEAPMEHLRWVN